jgi:hypothetical protein
MSATDSATTPTTAPDETPARCTACGDPATVAVGPLPYCAPCRDLIRRMERIDA